MFHDRLINSHNDGLFLKFQRIVVARFSLEQKAFGQTPGLLQLFAEI